MLRDVSSHGFSVVNGVLLKPLAYPAPERIVHIWESDGTSRDNTSPANFVDWRRESTLSNRVFTKRTRIWQVEAVTWPSAL